MGVLSAESAAEWRRRVLKLEEAPKPPTIERGEPNPAIKAIDDRNRDFWNEVAQRAGKKSPSAFAASTTASTRDGNSWESHLVGKAMEQAKRARTPRKRGLDALTSVIVENLEAGLTNDQMLRKARSHKGITWKHDAEGNVILIALNSKGEEWKAMTEESFLRLARKIKVEAEADKSGFRPDDRRTLYTEGRGHETSETRR